MTVAAARRGEDTDRTALQRAIEAAKEARIRLNEHEANIGRVQQLAQDADTKFDAAVAELNKAKDQHVKAIAAHAGGNKPSPAAGTIRQAKQAIEAAEDEGVAAAAAVKQLQAELPGLAMAHWQATAEVELAINALLSPLAGHILEKAKQLEDEFLALRAVLGVLVEDSFVRSAPDEIRAFNFGRRRDEVFGAELREKIKRFVFSDKLPDPTAQTKAREAAAQMRLAITGLHTDAAARLSEID
jgi:hypothetical protein